MQTYLLNIYYILNTVLDSKDTALNTMDKISTLTVFYCSENHQQ